EVFGGNYSIGQWPLRHELRLYIRKDVLANLWDYGVGAVQAEGLTDPYAENVLTLSPVMVLNESGLPGTDAGQFSAPRNVAVGPDGRIYVADSGNHRIQVFDANGNFVTMWGQFGVGPGEFNEPWGLAVDDQFVYVADTWNNRIQKFTLDGDYVAEFGTSGVGNGEGTLGLFYGPRDVLLLSDNRLLVTDTGNHRLQILDRDGNFLLELGGQGSLPGQFFEPVGLGLAANGDILVADTWNGRVQEITPDLVPVNTWRVEGWRSQSVNNKPYLAVDSNGRIYITDPENYRVIIFSPTGNYLARFGQFGNDTNSFGLPNGIAIDKQDNIYIADAVNNRILKFAPIFGQATSDTEENTLEDEAISEPVEQNGETGETGETEEERGDAEERGGETAVDDNAPTPSPTP
ncbi:MAG: 6-bladed beta-propeller, partial [Chloroflexi bacterium]